MRKRRKPLPQKSRLLHPSAGCALPEQLAELEKAKNEIQSAESKLTARKAELDKAREEIDRKSAELDAAEVTVSEKRAELDDALAKISENEQKIADGEAEYENPALMQKRSLMKEGRRSPMRKRKLRT